MACFRGPGKAGGTLGGAGAVRSLGPLEILGILKAQPVRKPLGWKSLELASGRTLVRADPEAFDTLSSGGGGALGGLDP